jgi:hypothetical protein
MLTPAEEVGLSGLNLAARVRKAFYQIPEPHLQQMMERIRDDSYQQHLFYVRDNKPEVIHVLACPLTILPDQLAYVHFVTITIQNALKRFPDLYLQDPVVRQILQLPPGEEEWLRAYWGPAQREINPVFGRHDAVLDFINPLWKDTLRFLEPNLGSIGGLHLVPTAEHIVGEDVLPALRARDPQLRLDLGKDIRDLLMQEVLDHLEAIGRPARTVCLIEPKYAASGPDEQEALARYYHDRFGLQVFHADVLELTPRGEEVCYEDTPLDLVYRDYSVSDLLTLERAGLDLRPIRMLFRQNRVISSVAAELDQKSCWEVLTDPEITSRHFNADERHVFQRHILWTRLLCERKTHLPDGRPGELMPFVRREQERLVLKPNRGYGGEGVLIGPLVSGQEWEAALERAVNDQERWVVQQLVSLPVSEFPVLGPDRHVHVEPFYTVLGFAPSRYGLAILGRASQKQVVNVAQRGGMCVVVVGQPPGRLLGPGQ